MEITVLFDIPVLCEKLLADYGLDKLDFTSSETKSSKTLQILSLFVGQKKNSVTRSLNYGNFDPYSLVESMKSYMYRVNFYEEWHVQLLVGMILHTTRGVSDLKIEGYAKRLPSRTSDGSPNGRFDISYKSEDTTYSVELKLLGEGDFYEGKEGSPIGSWKINKKSPHIYDVLFKHDPTTINTIQDTLKWATIQAASYVPEQKVDLYSGIVFVKNQDILLKSRRRHVYDIANDDDSHIKHIDDFNDEQLELIKKTLKNREYA